MATLYIGSLRKVQNKNSKISISLKIYPLPSFTSSDSVIFCGFHEIALRGHYETEDSLNPGGLRSLPNYSSQIDNDLERHLKTSKAFLEVSSTIQNEIL